MQANTGYRLHLWHSEDVPQKSFKAVFCGQAFVNN